jgi:uncharacterized protein YvpB
MTSHLAIHFSLISKSAIPKTSMVEKKPAIWQWVLIITFVVAILANVVLLFMLTVNTGQAKAIHNSSIEQIFQAPLLRVAIPTPTLTLTPFQPRIHWTQTPTQTRTPTPTATFTPTATATSTPVPPRPVIPAPVQASGGNSAYISNIHGAYQAYPLDCESRAAVDLAGYFGVQIGELDFQNHLPVSDNPNKGFVGNFRGTVGQLPPHDYGVYAGPVAALLRSYGLNAQSHQGLSFEDLQHEIAAGRPVMVWVINNTLYGTPKNYQASDGENVVVARYEHTVIVIGYDQTYVTILDGGGTYRRTVQGFMASWSVLGNMAVTAH